MHPTHVIEKLFGLVLLGARPTISQIFLVERTKTKLTMKVQSGAVLCMASLAVSAKAFSSRFASRNILRTTLAMVSTDAIVENPLLQQSGLPKFQSIQPKDLTPAVEQLLEKMELDFASLEKKMGETSSIDYDAVLPEVERIQFGISYAWGIAGHLNGVKNGDELREAYEANQPKVVQSITKFSQSKALYDALSAIEKSWEGVSDDSFEMMQKKRAVEGSLRGMTLGGVGLEGAEKERFNEIQMRLASLSNTFSNNVLDDTKAFSLTVDDAKKMEGVPDSAKALWANAHIQYLQSQAKEGEEKVPEMDAEAGPWRITLDMPSYIAIMSHMPDRELREQVYKAHILKASEKNESKNNVPNIYEILKLKTEMAKMLGYSNFADLSLSSKMAPSVDSVQELSNLIAEKALPAAKKELAQVTALARSKGGDEYSEASLDKLKPWDLTFWSERLKESKFDMTEEELRPYFALPAVLNGMFGLVQRIFDIEVKAADGETEVWHPDVTFYKVFDGTSGKHIASFYLDPYSRPEDKSGGAWMDTCIGKSKALDKDIPVAYLTCNGSPPVGKKPSLMTFGEVETLFHEFGHGLQHMLTRATEGDVAGINGVEVRMNEQMNGCDNFRFIIICWIVSLNCSFFKYYFVSGMLSNFLLNSWRIGVTTSQLSTVLPSTMRLANPSQKKCSKSFATKRTLALA
jgi:oligopeptidase A